MPRGRRKKPESYEEEIALFDVQIIDLTKKLQSLKQKRKVRIKKEEETKDADKWDLIRKSGFSADEIWNMVNKK